MYLKITALFLFVSCANIVPVNDEANLDRAFKITTACTSNSTMVDSVHESEDFAGNFRSGSYEYTCGERKYACRVWMAGYTYYNKCEAKI